VIALETNKDLILKDPIASFDRSKKSTQSDVTLLEVRRIRIYDQFNAIIDPVFERIVDLFEVQLGKLHSGMCYIARLSIPKGVKIFTLVMKPVVKIIMILNPVLPEYFINDLRVPCMDHQEHNDEEQE
jgi:hypothetical protein